MSTFASRVRHGIENRDTGTRGRRRKREREIERERARGGGGGEAVKRTSHKERRSGMERSARGWREGEYRDTLSDRNRYRDGRGNRVRGEKRGRVASRGFLYFSRKHYELVRKYLRRMALSYARGFARQPPDAALLRNFPRYH